MGPHHHRQERRGDCLRSLDDHKPWAVNQLQSKDEGDSVITPCLAFRSPYLAESPNTHGGYQSYFKDTEIDKGDRR